MKKELVCIGCPMGCRVTATVEDGKVTDVQGHGCKIGETYAREELTAPKRMVTSLMRVRGSAIPLPVKTTRPIAKERVFDCLREIANTVVSPPARIGDVVLSKVCGTDVDIVATRTLP